MTRPQPLSRWPTCFASFQENKPAKNAWAAFCPSLVTTFSKQMRSALSLKTSFSSPAAGFMGAACYNASLPSLKSIL